MINSKIIADLIEEIAPQVYVSEVDEEEIIIDGWFKVSELIELAKRIGG